MCEHGGNTAMKVLNNIFVRDTTVYIYHLGLAVIYVSLLSKQTNKEDNDN